MSSIPFTRASALTPFIGFSDAIGAPTDRLLDKVHISTRQLEEPEALVALFSSYRFVELLSRQEKAEDLGVILGERTSAFGLGAFGAALQDASTVGEYMETGMRLIGSLSSGQRFWISAEEDGLRLNQYLPGPPGHGRCLADVYTLVITISMLRRCIDANWSPDEVGLMAGDERLLGNRRFLGNARIRTGESHTSFTFPRSLLERPMAVEERKKQPEGTGSPEMNQAIPTGFRASIEQLIITLMNDENPTVQLTAELAGLSPRTLQRRLADAGYTYSGLLSEIKLRLAREWLIDSDMPVNEIAAALRYNDASNFARAFRRETGFSPQGYRRGHAPV